LPETLPESSPAAGSSAARFGWIAAPLRPYVWMLLGSLAIAVMATCAHALAERCHWELVATVRAGLALVLATALAGHAGARLVVWRPRILWVRSIAGTGSLLCMFYALPRLPPADVLTLLSMFPIWVALLSWPLEGRAPARDAWIAIGVGLLGVVLLAQPHFSQARPLAALAALAASVSTAVAMLGLHRLQAIDPRAVVAHFSGVSFVACLAVLAIDPASTWETSHFDAATLALLGGVGLFATIGQLFLTMAFAAGPPARVSVVALSQVGFAMIFDALVWRHQFGPWSLAGMALIMAPTAWLLLTERRLRGPDLSKRPPAP
jgi:drug/metabolite transporter (DMT)-like permease